MKHASILMLPKLALLAFALLPLAACETSGGGEGKGGDDLSGGGGGGKGGGDDDEGGGGAQASSNRVTFMNSYSNNPLTSHTVSAGKAESLAQRFSGGKDKRALEGRVSAARLARKGPGEVMAAARKLAEAEMEKGAGRTVSDDVKLEIALSALDGKNFALAEYYFQALTDSKDAKVRAGAYNAMGVVALRDDRVPEAVLYFRQALKASGGYRPALLNLGFAALRGGDMRTAKQALDGFGGDWFAQYALISVERVEGDAGRATDLCDKVLAKDADHKAALFNCGLVEFQNKRNFAKAKQLINKSAKAKHGESSWDSRALDLLAEVDMAESVARQADAKKKAQEKAKLEAAKEQKKPAQPVNQPAPPK